MRRFQDNSAHFVQQGDSFSMLQRRQRTANLIDSIDHRFHRGWFRQPFIADIEIDLDPPQSQQQIILEQTQWVIGDATRRYHATFPPQKTRPVRCLKRAGAILATSAISIRQPETRYRLAQLLRQLMQFANGRGGGHTALSGLTGDFIDRDHGAGYP